VVSVIVVPSPLAREGCEVVQRRGLGEGCLAKYTLTQSELAEASELPSPPRGEGTNMSAECADAAKAVREVQ
jgi:hypothetical protein